MLDVELQAVDQLGIRADLSKPATYILDGVRAALIDGVSLDRLLGDVWPLVVMAIVLIPVGVWGFGQAEAYAKRTGKLKRVG